MVTKNKKPKLTSAQLEARGLWAPAETVVWAVEQTLQEAMAAVDEHKAKGWSLDADKLPPTIGRGSQAQAADMRRSLDNLNHLCMRALLATFSMGYMPNIRWGEGKEGGILGAVKKGC